MTQSHYPVIELAIRPREIEVIYQNKSFLRISVDENNTLAVATPRFDEIEWTDESMVLKAKKIDVYTLIRETPLEGAIVAIPQIRRELATQDQVVRAPRELRRHTTSIPADRFDSGTKTQIVAAALDIYLQTNRKASALDIVARLGLDTDDKMPVAGVLAALTKGIYGEWDKLVAARRRSLGRANSAGSSAGA